MNRKLKMLGFAAIAALALSAVGASGASAVDRHFASEKAHTILDAEALATEHGIQKFTVTGGALGTECKKVSAHATIAAATVTEITATPTYSECEKSGGGQKVHVHMETCDYLFTATRTTTPGGVEDPHSQVHIKCTQTGDHIEIKATTIIGELNCLRVPPQTPTGGGVTYETGVKNGKHDITINATVTGIEYTEVGACGANHVTNDGTYTGTITVSGTDAGGAAVGITWT